MQAQVEAAMAKGTGFSTVHAIDSHHLRFEPLSEKEINDFFEELDKDHDGFVTLDELKVKLEEVHQLYAEEPKQDSSETPNRSSLPRRRKLENLEKGTAIPHLNPEQDGLHAFLHSLMPDTAEFMDRATFVSRLHSWQIPSQRQTSPKDNNVWDIQYGQQLPFLRTLRAHWAVEGLRFLFWACVVSLQLAFSIWQGVKYVQDPQVRAALGWGVILAKFSAGALYPTLFFMFLSMSRWFATAMRRFYHISKFINFDYSQRFHIIMACEAFVLASLHSIGHLTGTFLYSTRPSQQDNLAQLFAPRVAPKSYADWVALRPGWSGLTAYGLFILIVVFSLPKIRKQSYELFQVVHLLMFPFSAMLCVHGTASLLQSPALGYVIAFPLALVIGERANRLVRGFIKVPARVEALDEGTVVVTCHHPSGKDWRYQPGQYIFLQVPAVSYFQWHPFTVSTCEGSVLQVHIKCQRGGWTDRLQDLASDQDISVGIDGPFGAPAQRFYYFDRSIIVGSGIGVTPFSAILSDLAQRVNAQHEDPWRSGRKIKRSSSQEHSRASSEAPAQTTIPSRRVDFLWSVHDRNDLLWFSSLLNRVHALSRTTSPTLTINIHPFITANRGGLGVHVFRYLLDRYRTATSPVSTLTGLEMESSFGRPNLEAKLKGYHEEMREEGFGGKVGVFFCGNPKIGKALSDACDMLTARAKGDGSGVRYIFMTEVF